ncbi:hypothetical protein ACEQUB_p01515 (plasmid) [Ralstonia syzygii]
MDCTVNPLDDEAVEDSHAGVACDNDDGEYEPNVKPPRVRENEKPASLSTVLLNSTTRTSTCTVPGTAMVVLSTMLPLFDGSAPPATAAALRARARE